MEILPRIFKCPKGSFFLFGPRGTGKSTLLRQYFPEAIYVDLLAPETFRMFSAKPERLVELIEGTPQKNKVIIDEIQKVPQLLDVVHHLMETENKYQFILIGSSSRKLKRTGIDLLAGRAVVRTLHPFLAVEMGDIFNLENSLHLGMIPLIRAANTPQEVEFIIYGPENFVAIEVKDSRTVYPKDTGALRSFIQDYPEAMPVLLYRGKNRLKIAGIICITCEEFLHKLHPAKPIPAV